MEKDLPNEMWEMILVKMDPDTLTMMGSTCKKYRNIAIRFLEKNIVQSQKMFDDIKSSVKICQRAFLSLRIRNDCSPFLFLKIKDEYNKLTLEASQVKTLMDEVRFSRSVFHFRQRYNSKDMILSKKMNMAWY